VNLALVGHILEISFEQVLGLLPSVLEFVEDFQQIISICSPALELASGKVDKHLSQHSPSKADDLSLARVIGVHVARFRRPKNTCIARIAQNSSQCIQLCSVQC
jgi:hypothetical protein